MVLRCRRTSAIYIPISWKCRLLNMGRRGRTATHAQESAQCHVQATCKTHCIAFLQSRHGGRLASMLESSYTGTKRRDCWLVGEAIQQIERSDEERSYA